MSEAKIDLERFDTTQSARQLAVDTASSREYTIGELAASYGVSHRTLRFYEQRGLLYPMRRGAQRIYSSRDRVRLDVIVLAKRLGFSLTEIWKLIQSRFSEAADVHAGSASIASLGLSKEQIGAQVEHLVRERETVQRAIEELREAASRVDGLAAPL